MDSEHKDLIRSLIDKLDKQKDRKLVLRGSANITGSQLLSIRERICMCFESEYFRSQG